MVQYPTNVYPDNVCFDADVSDSNNRIAFQFNGDIMTGILVHVYNYNTGALIYDTGDMYQAHNPIKYNGQEYYTANGFFDNHLDNGEDYALQLMPIQYTADGSTPLCDMFMLRGLVQQNYLTTDTYMVIEDKASSIYEWSTTSEQGWRNMPTLWGVAAGVCEIVIGEERRYITAYNEDTGEIALSSAFSSNIPANTKYQIYCNYKVSPLYFFKCRETPTVTPTLAVQDYSSTLPSDSAIGFHVSSTFSGGTSLINHYQIKLYWNYTGDNTVPWRLVDESPVIYSQLIDYTFFDDFVLHYKKRVYGEIVEVPAEENTDLYYKAVVEVVTTDGLSCTGESSVISCGGSTTTDVPETEIQYLVLHNQDKPDTYYPDSMDSSLDTRSRNLKHWVHIVGGKKSGDAHTFPANTKYTYYREDLQTGELRPLESVDDTTIPTKGKFRYWYVPRSVTGSAYLKSISHLDIELTTDESFTRVSNLSADNPKGNLNGYTITELILREEAYQWGTKLRYRIGDQWKFVGEIQDNPITQNMDKYLHINYSTYPTLTSTKTNYLSGTVTALNGYVDCTTKKYTDDIDLVRAWREFISRQGIYMLKTQKGDVLIVAITDNPTTTYSEQSPYLETTFTFNWTEVANVKDIKVDYVINMNPNNNY